MSRRPRSHNPARTLTLTVALALTAAAGLLAAPATAAPPRLTTGFTENQYFYFDDAVRNHWFEQTVAVNAGMIRVNAIWSVIATSKPANPRNPSDPAYNFTDADIAVRSAAAHGLSVMMTVYHAPPFAAGANVPNGVDPGTWRPSPKAFGDFAAAAAKRYSGSFDPGAGKLPRVQFFEAWNEPNLSDYLTPQYRGTSPVGAKHYRKLLNAFYAGVKSTNKRAKVIAGATAPYGSDPPNAPRTRPLLFLREVLCLRGSLRNLQSASCPNKPKFDILSHHPITLSGGPNTSAISIWDAAIPDFHNVASMLRAAESKGTLATRGRHPLWASELWWQTKPPDPQGVPVRQHALWLEEALYSLWRQGAPVVMGLQLVDGFGGNGDGGIQTGLFFADGRKKPAFQAWRFPFVLDRLRGPAVKVWTIPPRNGRLQIQRKVGKNWRTIARAAGRDGKILQRTLRIPGSVTLRGVVGGEKSLAFSVSGPGGKGARRQPLSRSAAAPAPWPYVETP